MKLSGPLRALVLSGAAWVVAAGCQSERASETGEIGAGTKSREQPRPGAPVSAWPGRDSGCPVDRCKRRPRRAIGKLTQEPPFEAVLAAALEAETNEALFRPMFEQAQADVAKVAGQLLAHDPNDEVGRMLSYPPFGDLFRQRTSFAFNLVSWQLSRSDLVGGMREGMVSPIEASQGFRIPDALGARDVFVFGWHAYDGPVIALSIGWNSLTVIPAPSQDDCEESSEGRVGRGLLAIWDHLELVGDVCAPPGGWRVVEVSPSLTSVAFRGEQWEGHYEYFSAHVLGRRVVLDLHRIIAADDFNDPYRGPPRPSLRANGQWSQ